MHRTSNHKWLESPREKGRDLLSQWNSTPSVRPSRWIDCTLASDNQKQFKWSILSGKSSLHLRLFCHVFIMRSQFIQHLYGNRNKSNTWTKFNQCIPNSLKMVHKPMVEAKHNASARTTYSTPNLMANKCLRLYCYEKKIVRLPPSPTVPNPTELS